MFCPKCGSKLPDDAAFCGKCGARLDQPKAPTGKGPELGAPAPRAAAVTAATGARPRSIVPVAIIGVVVIVLVVVLVRMFACSGNGVDVKSADGTESSAASNSSSQSAEASSESAGGAESSSLASSSSASSNASSSAGSSSASASIKPAAFILEGSGSAVGDGLALTDGTKVPVAIEGADEGSVKMEGRFREGYAFVRWSTSDYDKEWKEKTNVVYHLGLVDGTGKLVKELDDIIPPDLQGDYSDEEGGAFAHLTGSPYFSGGYALVQLSSPKKGGDDVICIDSSGKACWAVANAFQISNGFEDGLARIGTCIYDTGGNVVFDLAEHYNEKHSEAEESDYLWIWDNHKNEYRSAGKGFVLLNGESTDGGIAILDYTSKVVLSSQSTFEGYDECSIDDAHSGAAIVSLKKTSPNGTRARKDFCGLWSIADGKWLIEPVEDGMFFYGDDNIVCVRANQHYSYYLIDGTYIGSDSDLVSLGDSKASYQRMHRLDGDWYALDNSHFIHVGTAGIDAYEDLSDTKVRVASSYYG